MSIEYPNLDRIINEYFKGNITLDDLVTKYQLSANQTNFIKKNIIKIVKQREMLENKEDSSYEIYESSIIIPKEISESRKFSESDTIEIFKRMNELSCKEMNYKEKVEYDSIREELVIRYKPLVDWCIANLYSKVNIPLEEVEMLGYEGLIRAINQFDYQKGKPFQSYALSSITRNIERHFKDIYGIEWMEHLNNIVLKSDDIIIKQVLNESDAFTEPDIFNGKTRRTEIPMTEEDYLALDDYEDLLSTESPINIEDMIYDSDLRRLVKEVVSELPEIHKNVLNLRYGLEDGEPKTIKETATILNKTEDIVRNAEARAVRKLLNPKYSIRLREYYGYNNHHFRSL